MPEPSRYTETLTLLRNRPRCLTLEEIGKRANVTIHWLERLSQGKINEPGIHKVERVYAFLKTYKPVA